MVWIAPLLFVVSSGTPIDQFEADRGRIQRHLARVEAELRAAPTDHLDPVQKLERARNLDRLHAYWTAGQFPHNTDFAGRRVPYFIDDDGRACAVGHLVIESGAPELADRIQASENNALLADMRTEGLLDWVRASGLSAAECAKIQPAYCDCAENEAPVCGSDGVTYLNECYATTCAGVEVAYEGVCEGEATTGFPAPGTGDDGGSTSAGATSDATGAPATSNGEGDDAGDGGDDADKDKDDDDDDKGCRVAGHAPAPTWLALLMLAGYGVRRRRLR